MGQELPVTPHSFSLAEKYDAETGTVLVSGVQALVRAVLTRARLDRAQDLDTGGFISGYRGSPLGGLDQALWQEESRLAELGIKFQPGINEDLAATGVWGSQQVGLHEGHTVEGVFGLWYGKAPGLDRSCDAIRHANMWGTSARGGALLVVGDDPAAKSSSLASASEFTLQDLMVPVLSPANLQDVLDFAVIGWEMSRESGLWVGLKAIADQMDANAVVDVGLDRYADLQARPDKALHIRVEDTPLEQERRALEEKLPAALAYARRARLNRWITPRPAPAVPRRKARLGLVCAGKAYADVREALGMLGLRSEQAIHDAGLSLLKLGMTWPLDEALMVDFASHAERVLVVEEKRAFVEPQVVAALHRRETTRRIAVLGKQDEAGRALMPSTGMLDVVTLAGQLAGLAGLPLPEGLATVGQSVAQDLPARKERTPLFCAGCPHNTSTRVPEGSRATAGIGCHYMVNWMDRRTDSCTQMGGEGVTWMGEAPFTREQHLFANLGDGTYFHSGALAIRQAVAAKLNMTYKVLFNDAVAMTGGQKPDGQLTVEGLIDQVRAEGVQRICIVSDEPARHTRLGRLAGVTVHGREMLDDVQCELRETAGVSVLVYQQTCATQLRKDRKRGHIADDRPRVVINPDVCDGCGDCSAQSSCVAVEPVVTPDGVKRTVNQTTCNKDLSCATGFCPAFVEVEGPLRVRRPDLAALPEVPEPAFVSDSADVLITGIGGTGIVTLSALLAAAAKIEGKAVNTLDMTGLAQKGGAVFAHVRLSPGGRPQPRIARGTASLLVGCDLVSSASTEALELLSPATLAVLNSHVTPTAEFALGKAYDAQTDSRLRRVEAVTAGNLQAFAVEDYLRAVMGGTQQANVMLLGMAYQSGRLPLALASMEAAFRINGVQVAENLYAFHLGRLAAADREALPAAAAPRSASEPAPTDLAGLKARHVAQLETYQDAALAQRYLDFVAKVERTAGGEAFAMTVASSYARLLMIKDEYEVARLMAGGAMQTMLEETFAEGYRHRYLMAPPLLGSRKRRLPGWLQGMFAVLGRFRGIRNTWLDPFAYTGERRRDLAMIGHYEQLVDRILARLNRQNLPTGLALAALPQEVRGYGHVKARQWREAQAREAALWETFTTPPEPVRLFDPHMDEAA